MKKSSYIKGLSLIICVLFSKTILAQLPDGFDTKKAYQTAINKGIPASDIEGYVQYLHNDFITHKGHNHKNNTSSDVYDMGTIYKNFNNNVNIFRSSNPNTPQNTYCPNAGFEQGNFTNWTGGIGTVATGPVGAPFPTYNQTSPTIVNPSGINAGLTNTANYHTVMTVPATNSVYPNCAGYDSIACKVVGTQTISEIPIVNPNGGPASVRMNGAMGNQRACKLNYNMTLNPNNKSFSVSYALVLQNGGHLDNEQAYFSVKVTDQNGNFVPGCSVYTINVTAQVTNTSSPLYDPSWAISAIQPGTPTGGNGASIYRKWQTFAFDFTNYPAITSVNVEFYVGGCSYGGHYGYAYVDAQCALGGAISSFCSGSNTTILSAPAGYTTYQWTGPSGVVSSANGGNTATATITPVTAGQVFTCNVTAPNGCVSVFQTTVSITSLSITSVGSSPSCPSGNTGSANVTATGSSTGYTYQWLNSLGASVGNTQTANGLSPGTYSVIVTSALCGSATTTVNVGTAATTFYSLPASFCGSTATITKPGGSNYSWYTTSPLALIPGATTATLNISSPVNGTNYILVNTTTSGCKDSIKYTLSQQAAGNLYVNQIKSICVGNSNSYAVVHLQTSTPPLYSYTVTGPSGYNSVLNNTSALKDSVTNLSIGVYTATVLDGLCTYKTTFTVNPFVYNYTLTPISASICASGNASLTVNLGIPTPTCGLSSNNSCDSPNIISIGTNTTANTTASYPAIYGNNYKNSRHQILYTANELLTAGILPGKISSISFKVNTINGATTYPNFTIKMKCTGVANLSTNVFDNTGLTQVYFSSAINITTGWNTYQFTTPYEWDGVSNILIDVCNSLTTNFTQNSSSPYTTTTFPSVRYYRDDNLVACMTTLAGTISNNRPNIRFENCGAMTTNDFTYSWTPSSGLSSTTTFSTVANPSISTIYTVQVNPIGQTNCAQAQTSTITIINTLSTTATTTLVCNGGSSILSATGATSYTWSPGGANTASITVTPSVSTIYTVTGANGSCISTKTISITISNPTLNVIANPTVLCAGNSATLTASGMNSYTWNPSGLNGASITVNPLITTTYSVTGTNTLGCTASNTIALNVSAIPVLTVSATNTLICSGNSTALSANGAVSYTWNPGNLTGPLVVVSPSVTTTYTVMGTNSSGCSGIKTIKITVNPTPSVTATANPTIMCAGSSATLSANGATSYIWNPGAFTGGTITVTPSVTTTYTVIGTSATGCVNTKTIKITISKPNLIIISNPAALCIGSTATLTVSGAASYTWNPSGITTNTIAVTPTTTTVYSVTGTNTLGCTSSKTLNLTVSPIPTVAASASPSVICAGQSLTLTATGATSYTWNPSGITTAIAIVSPSVNTTYTLNGKAGACSSSNTVAVTVNPLPTLSLAASSNSICSGGSITLTASGSSSSYSWSPGNLTGNVITVSPATSTTYSVTGSNGTCSKTNTINIIVGTYPTILLSASSNSICSGASANLTANGATSYSWSPLGSNGNNVTVTPSVSTTYTVSGDNGSGCIASNTLVITVNPLPNIFINPSASTICSSASVTLTANGANSYTWNPGNLNGATISDSPMSTTTYTVNGNDAVGCANSQTVTINVITTPTLITSATAYTICEGYNTTLNVNGATSYTWNPSGSNGTSLTVSPTIPTTYSVTGDNGNGCIANSSIAIYVIPSSSLTAVANPSSTCPNYTVNLTASGAISYTWMPMGTNGASIITAPGVSTTYTVLGDNGTCVSSKTVLVNVTPGPANVTANASGTITCAVASVNLFGNSTSAPVTYLWAGPNSYTAATQNPTGITQAGTYSLGVVNLLTGCVTIQTLTVLSNTTSPDLTATVSGSIGCLGSVTLNAISSNTNTANYNWSGPFGYTSTLQNPITTIAGDYTVSVMDTINGCIATTTLSIGTDTTIPSFSATITQATCAGAVANNNGTINLTGFNLNDHFDLVQANSYTGSTNYASATAIPVSGTIVNSLPNPTTPTLYTIRIFGSNGCYHDTTLTLMTTYCGPSTYVLGMAKAVSTPTFVNNGAYNVTYTIIATNTSTVDFTNFSVIDNLNNTFPLPTTYTVLSTPIITSLNTSLTINPSFNGSSQSDLLIPASSTLTAGRQDTIVLNVQINPNGLFGPFNNSAIGIGTDDHNLIAVDSSNNGFVWDPDNNGVATDNDTATVVSLTPNITIGIAKSGSVSGILPDKTLDVTYVITVSNLGNDTLSLVQVLDSLTIPAPATFYIKSGPTATGSLTANPAYNGNSDTHLLIANTSSLAPGQSETITLVLNVTPNGLNSIINIAVGDGKGLNGGVVRDSSNMGAVADPNDNYNPTEVGENIPTVLTLPDVNLFIPDAFTPDGDGKNDVFFIKGIDGRTTKLTVFNRWGSKVYENNAYDNSWNGTTNVSTLMIGNNKLPQGTYYFIVEFADNADKPVNGFVVLQY